MLFDLLALPGLCAAARVCALGMELVFWRYGLVFLGAILLGAKYVGLTGSTCVVEMGGEGSGWGFLPKAMVEAQWRRSVTRLILRHSIASPSSRLPDREKMRLRGTRSFSNPQCILTSRTTGAASCNAKARDLRDQSAATLDRDLV